MADLGILVVAHGIDRSIVERFKTGIRESKPKVSYDIMVLGDEVCKGEFCKTKLLNAGMEKLFEGNYLCILQTDIDLIMPPGLIDHAFNRSLEENACIHHCMRRVSEDEFLSYATYADYPWKKWGQYKRIYASGCFNMMSPKLWYKSGGWNPEMTSWGGEDTRHRQHAISFGIQWKDVYKFALMHVDHPRRTPINTKANYEADKNAKARGIQNWFDWRRMQRDKKIKRGS